MIGGTGPSRLDVAVGLLAGDQQVLIRKLAETHALRFYRFSRDASALGTVPPPDPKADKNAPRQIALDPKLVDAIRNLKPEGGATQVVPSLLTVLGDLQGQRLAGVVLVTDARETPAAASPAVVDRLKRYGAKIVAVPVGSESPLKNVAVTSLSVQDSAFKDDLVSVKVGVRAAGFEQGKQVRVRLKDKRTGQPLQTAEGRGAEATATFADDRPQEVEVVFQPKEVGTLDLVAEADGRGGRAERPGQRRPGERGRPRREDQRPVRRRLPAVGVPVHQERDDPGQDREHLVPAHERGPELLPGGRPARAGQRPEPPRDRQEVPRRGHPVPRERRGAGQVRRGAVRRRRPAAVHRPPAPTADELREHRGRRVRDDLRPAARAGQVPQHRPGRPCCRCRSPARGRTTRTPRSATAGGRW
jgi:hypothetical protein